MWRNRWSLRYRGLECPAGSSCSSKQWEVVGPLPSFCPCHLEGFLRAADAQSLPWVPLLFLGGGGENAFSFLQPEWSQYLRRPAARRGPRSSPSTGPALVPLPVDPASAWELREALPEVADTVSHSRGDVACRGGLI